MKTIRLSLSTGMPLLAAVVLGIVCAFTASRSLASPDKPASPYTAHEWGTFTSVQGADGVLLSWQPLQTSQLPEFVYNWGKPGLNRAGKIGYLLKGGMSSLQRMETPVIYFYSDQAQSVDVSVRFPEGFITEWYPQADRIGPSSAQDGPGTASDSRIEWSGLKIIPSVNVGNAASLLPSDKSGSHYFAARETDSALVERNALSDADPMEHEKFLFYRGVGNFSTPVRVTMDGDKLTVSNTAWALISHAFVLTLHDGHGTYFQLDKIGPGENRSVQLKSDNQVATADLENLLDRAVADALTSEGLYRREAEAMVNTWKDTWFAEDGVRVLYILPRGWTDLALPIAFKPAPQSLVRVMVGRAEVLSPALEQNLLSTLTKAQNGDEASRQEAAANLQKLGRFGEPALRLATRSSSDAALFSYGFQLLPRTPQH